MRKRASILITDGNKILLMHRIKKGVEYYVLPGGGAEEGESVREAAIREAKEETGLDVVIDKEQWIYIEEESDHVHHCLSVASFAGELMIGGPEKDRQSEDNIYELVWVNRDQLEELPIRPEGIKVLML